MVISHILPWEENVPYDLGKNRIHSNQSWSTIRKGKRSGKSRSAGRNPFSCCYSDLTANKSSCYLDILFFFFFLGMKKPLRLLHRLEHVTSHHILFLQLWAGLHAMCGWTTHRLRPLIGQQRGAVTTDGRSSHLHRVKWFALHWKMEWLRTKHKGERLI